uniref:Uncharacterized protein n=1 Tax=Octopus bimaculoides TaxID=37653 RepID=A0A0L8FPE4_OCTBM
MCVCLCVCFYRFEYYYRDSIGKLIDITRLWVVRIAIFVIFCIILLFLFLFSNFNQSWLTNFLT